MAIESDEYNPNIQYQWRMSTTSADNALDKTTKVQSTTNVGTLNVQEPGWYSGQVVSSLNRKVKDTFSTVCKVTNKPQPPVVAYQGNETLYTTNAEPAKLTIETSIAKTDEKLSVDLFYDTIHYVWQIRPINAVDNGWTTIGDNDAGISGQGTDTLTVTPALPYAGANFRCLAINELNGSKAVFDHSGTYINDIDFKLGDFKNEPPYIFAENKAYTYTVLNME
jgi:hypothetical protein